MTLVAVHAASPVEVSATSWFEDGPPGWAVEQVRFPVVDNRIAGEDLIAIYELRWDAAMMP